VRHGPDDALSGRLYRSSEYPEEAVTDPVVTPDPHPAEPTPEPVLKAAAVWGSLATIIVTLLGVASAVGVLSTEQSAMVTDVVGYVSANIVPVGSALLGAFTLVSGIVASFATATVARRKVTPVVKASTHHRGG
jgi:hypothetical protein